MDREPTLDEFGPDEGEALADDGEAGEATGEAPADERATAADGESADDGTAATDGAAGGDESTPERATAPVTCEWTPAGAACEACGATVERRWRDGDARVCVDCKEW